ncbi:hypothetical protein BaRGS_00004310 [Batillaria attramentaria]|uniref:LRAT domain-containing protein n=1 Tax=Batillaria attramentaria TaxID=370345 RepID=A0ABD0LZJ1_9CAEN|nr:hypothetical protein BaRGS_020853 [Batillaria attramentaria]
MSAHKMMALKIITPNERALEDLETGDIIEIQRGPHSHWAVYIGNQQVIHLAGGEDVGIDVQFKQFADPTYLFNIAGKLFKTALVKVDAYANVVHRCLAKKNNSKDWKYKPLSKSEIVQNAMSRLGRHYYNVQFENCEHFATWCRYGVKKSDQQDTFLTWNNVNF